MSRAMVAGIVAILILAFIAGWQVANWQRDSVELVVNQAVTKTGNRLAEVASQSGRQLENKLEDLRNAPPREIRTEVVKPVFTHRCLSDDFVSMYNQATASTERALSGKLEN